MMDNNTNQYIQMLQKENAFLNAAAHGLDKMVKEAQGLLMMCRDFMASVEYGSPIDAAQCCGILNQIREFLDTEDDENE